MPLLTFNELGSAVQKSAGSIREDLMDFIDNLSPDDTPLYNNLGQVGVSAGFVESLEDTLRATATNAWVEGNAATDGSLATPTRNATIIQCFQEHFHVSGRQLAVRHAGLSNMLSYQGVKAMKVLKNDIELALVAGSAVSGTTTVAPQTAGIFNKLSTCYTSSSGTTLTETVLNDILALAYSYKANLRELYSNMLVKRTINSYNSGNTHNREAASKIAGKLVDVYESEVGVIALFKERNISQASSKTTQGNSWFAIDPDYFKVAILRAVKEDVLGKDGDRERRMLVGELGLLVRSEKAGVGGDGYVSYIT